MPLNTSQLETLLRSPALSQVIGGALAIILALVTALGGAAGSSDETNGANGSGNNPTPGISAPAPTGKAVDLYDLVDAGDAVKGSIRIKNKTYAKSWNFGSWDRQTVQLNREYRTLKATVGVIDGQAIGSRSLSLTINGQKFVLDKDNPVREVEVNVTNVDTLKINSIYSDGPRVGLANPVVYK